MKVNVLGTEYDFDGASHREDVRLCDNDGYVDFTTKTIRFENNLNGNNPNSIANIPEYENKIKRHEITHAFFYESGLDSYAHNELLVDWIAIQFPKMLKAFKKAGAL